MDELSILKNKFAKTICMLCIILAVGIAFLIIGFTLKLRTDQKINQYTPITGIVVDYEENKSDGNYLYAEIAQFTVDGKTYTVTNNLSSSSPAKIGEQIKLYYNPNNPNECVFANSNTFMNIFTIFAGVFTAVAIYLIIKEIVKYHKAKSIAQQNSSTTTTQSMDNNDKIIL